LKLPFDKRWSLNQAPSDLANGLSFILDTTTVRTYMPEMRHGDFDRYGFLFYNAHKKMFGAKLEIPVAMQRTPFPIGISVVPAGFHDLSIARRPGGVFSKMGVNERALGDPGYVGQSDKIYAPSRRSMNAFVPELDKVELSLQRRVEMANDHMKTFDTLGTTFRKGAVRAFPDLSIIGVVIAKVVAMDMLANQEHSGPIHTTGPTRPVARPAPIRPARVAAVHRVGKKQNVGRRISVLRRSGNSSVSQRNQKRIVSMRRPKH
jgi:hypothetical protein